MTFAEYADIDAVNWSPLSAMRDSPLHYAHRLRTPRTDTPALAMGRAIHTAVLEPDAFPLGYVVRPDGIDRRTKAGKEIIVNSEDNMYSEVVAIQGGMKIYPDTVRDKFHSFFRIWLGKIQR